MLTKKNMETTMGIVLTVGTFVSAAIVLFGGIFFLAQYGDDTVQTELLISVPGHIDAQYIWHALTTFSSLGIIELGLLSLVATQILRVGLLVWYYASIKDYYFFWICSFVLLVILSTFIYNFVGLK